VVTLQKDNEGGGKKFRPAGIRQMCEERGLKWLHLPLSGKNCLAASVIPAAAAAAAGGDNGGGFDRLDAEKQGHSPDTVSLSGVQEVATMLRGGESVVLHCDTGVQRSGIVAYLALRHCNLAPSEALELLGADKTSQLPTKTF
jgi:hypothetical protein